VQHTLPSRRPKLLAGVILAAMCVLACRISVGQAAKEDPEAKLPLYKQQPWDQVTLNKKNKSKVLNMYPLPLPGRVVPPKGKRKGWIEVRLFIDPDPIYELDLAQVTDIKLFEQMIFDKAKLLVAEKQFDEAFGYLAYLRRKHPQMAGLDELAQRYLFLDAGASHQAKQFDAALSSLNQLLEINKDYPGLARAHGAVMSQLIHQRVDQGNYVAARGLMQQLEDNFPKEKLAAVAQWKIDFAARAKIVFAKADQAHRKKDYTAARQLCLRSLGIWPSDDARELLTTVHRKHPEVVIGVATPYSPSRQNRFLSAAARRTDRLRFRPLLELRGHGGEGGQYRCPFGEFTRGEEGDSLTFRLDRGVVWSPDGRELSGYDVARGALTMADRRSSVYRPAWQQIFSSVAVNNVTTVRIELTRPHVRPDAFLQSPSSLGVTADRPETNGPYTILPEETGNTDDMRFVVNKKYFALGRVQPKQLVERTYADSAAAAKDLRNGNISVLARVGPAELDALGRSPQIVVDRYAAPTVHCLIPNFQKRFTANRSFRRALLYAINRPRILRDDVLAGTNPKVGELRGNLVLSGPFPFGEGQDDPIAYGYDRRIKPRSFRPRVALMLAQLALEEERKREKARGGKLDAIPTLVLAHPPVATARIACRAIADSWKRIDLKVELHELSRNDLMQMSDKYDLMYVELAMWEPVVDAGRLLGPGGIAAGSSPYMDQALQTLARTTNWEDTRRSLHEVHRMAHDAVAVIPLWQVYDHFAFRKSLRGITERPFALYENIEGWQVGIEVPGETPE